MSTKEDFTPAGTKLEGNYENDRNGENSDLYKAIIRECFNVTDVIVAHHLTYATHEKRGEFTYEIIEEIPSADTLIFDHDVAKRIWPKNWPAVLTALALKPVPERDKLLAEFYYGRNK